MKDNYHDRPEWSYSDMKLIPESGIDYAVAAKRGLIPGPDSKSIDLGECVHMLLLGGEDYFVLQEDSGFKDFKTKAAREWRDGQKASGKTIITRAEWEAIVQIVTNIEAHPYTQKYLLGDGFKHEVEMYAKADGVELRGKADALKVDGDSLIVTDIKTTSKFNQWKKDKRYPIYQHYDLQAAVYTMIAASANKISPARTNYYFCVVETVMPYRVKFFHGGLEFVESGERKLRGCIDQIKAFGDKEPSFLDMEVGELGDWSL